MTVTLLGCNAGRGDTFIRTEQFLGSNATPRVPQCVCVCVLPKDGMHFKNTAKGFKASRVPPTDPDNGRINKKVNFLLFSVNTAGNKARWVAYSLTCYIGIFQIRLDSRPPPPPPPPRQLPLGVRVASAPPTAAPKGGGEEGRSA
jgi:hypothetical protein